MSSMTQLEHSRKAQIAAKTYLEMRGYTIIEQNWRQSRYTIDIIATKNHICYFVRVRLAHNHNPKGKLEVLNDTTIKQMQQAAARWVIDYKWSDAYQLSTIEIDSANYAVLSFIDNEL
jgi:Holliday junction resolvase-like predicted endonuclease